MEFKWSGPLDNASLVGVISVTHIAKQKQNAFVDLRLLGHYVYEYAPEPYLTLNIVPEL